MIRSFFTHILLLALIQAFASAATAENLVVLGSCATLLTENQNRIHNIALALNRIDNVVIPSGHRLSFNRAVGNRTPARGYLPAPVLFQDRLSVQIGGGTCQASSTLYNAALLADMEIIERHRHSAPVTYLPIGLDATVAYGYKDLVFRNPHPFPVRIATALTDDVMTVSVMAESRLGYEVTLDTQVSEIESPFPGDRSQNGIEVHRYRLRKKDGVIIEREFLGRDYYHPSGGGVR